LLIKRRSFVTLLGGAAATWPLGVGAQPAGMPVIGFLHSAARGPFGRLVEAFHEGIGKIDYVVGRNVQVEYRWAEGHEDRLKPLAEDLVRRNVVLICAAGGSFVAVAAQAVTTTIPIVFVIGSDPVQLGLVASLNRPGGNATGVTLESTNMLAKRLETLQALVPDGTRIAMLQSSAPTVERFEAEFVKEHRLLGFKLRIGKELEPSEYEQGFDAAIKRGAGGLLVSADPLFMDRRDLITALAAKHAMPAVYPWRQYAAAGGLVSYGPNIIDAYRDAGRYAGLILKGSKPADLPVLLPTKFELVINLATAKALNITVPRLIFARADELIE
jgi:putative tryptophan/tyrosine transport system substrate-binding protein